SLMVSRKIYPSFLMNIFLNGIIEPFLKITEMHKLFIFHSLARVRDNLKRFLREALLRKASLKKQK
ncbi:MAG: hypothetical protein RLZZ139_2466, partial [Cyanobacteriota bacterium]